jgi:hypothetical protein
MGLMSPRLNVESRLMLLVILPLDVQRYHESPRPSEPYARAVSRGRLAPPQEGAPARPRTRRSRWLCCLGQHGRTARAGSPLAGRRCQRTRAGRRRQLERKSTAARTREKRCASRRATAAHGLRADFLKGPCGPTAVRRRPRRSQLAVNSWEGERGRVQVCERGQCRDTRRYAAGEAVTAEGPVPQRANSHARVGRKVARR